MAGKSTCFYDQCVNPAVKVYNCWPKARQHDERDNYAIRMTTINKNKFNSSFPAKLKFEITTKSASF